MIYMRRPCTSLNSKIPENPFRTANAGIPTRSPTLKHIPMQPGFTFCSVGVRIAPMHSAGSAAHCPALLAKLLVQLGENPGCLGENRLLAGLGAAGPQGCLHSLLLNASTINHLIQGGKNSPLAATRQSVYWPETLLFQVNIYTPSVCQVIFCYTEALWPVLTPF